MQKGRPRGGRPFCVSSGRRDRPLWSRGSIIVGKEGRTLNWIDIIWIGCAGACLTLGVLHLLIWLRNRRDMARLAFAALVCGVVGTAGCEIAMMRAETVPEFTAAVRWIHLPVLVLVAGSVTFLRLYFGVGRLWLIGAAIGTRLVAVVVNFAIPSGVSYRSVTGIHQIELLGQTVTVAEGLPNPWAWVARASSLLVFAFAVDVGVTFWRRADPTVRRRAWSVAGSIAFFSLAAVAHSALVQLGVIESPYLISLFFLVPVGAMGVELTNDVARAADLSQRLRNSEAEAGLAAEAANLGTWVWDIAADRVRLSDRTRDLFRFPAPVEPTMGQMLERIHPDDRDDVRRALDQALTGKRDLRVEYRLPDGANEVHWMSSRGGREVAKDGTPVRMRGVSVDVTERRRAEIDAHNRLSELAHLSRVALVGELSGSLAHELNQPLGAILSNAQAMRRLLARPDTDAAELRAILDDIVGDVHHAAEVLQRVRSLIRRSEPLAEPLQVADVVRDALQLIRAELADQGIALETRLEADLPPVQGDPTQLRQVVLNLIVNAVDAMAASPPGSRVLEVTAGRAEAGGVEVRVTDRGPGIRPDLLDRLFDPFVTTKERGLGMGLAISRSIVEAHDGRIRAWNDAGRGTTVAFVLPASGAGQG